MLNWILSILGQGGPSQRGRSRFKKHRKIVDLEARLVAESDKSCRGELECEAWETGDWKIDIEVDHPETVPAGPWRVFVDGRQITEMQPSRLHETELSLRSGRDTLDFRLEAGMDVEIRNAEGAFLTGTLQTDR